LPPRAREILDPADGSVLERTPDTGAEAVAAAIGRATAAQVDWARRAPAERGAALAALAGLLEGQREELAELEARNTGRTITETRGDVGGAVRTLRYNAGVIDAFGGDTLPVGAPGLLLTRPEPIGVCAAITAWNAPLYLAVLKAAPALVTGNAVVLKPSELTPLTSLRLAELARAAGLPEGIFEVVTGGAETGAALVGDKAVGRVTFTGSTAVGRSIAESVAGSFKRITLELGGKSACVVFPDVDPVKVGAIAPGAAFGMAGQDCCARSRVIVHEDIKDAFLESYVETMRAIRLGPPLDPDTEMGPLISAAHRDRVDGFVARSRAEGGAVLAGGESPGGDLAAGSYYRPTVVDGVGATAELAQAEVFGPVVAVMTFRTEEEAVRLANDTEFGLSGSIWTADVGRALRVSRAMRAGVLAINSNTSVYPEAPFGGVGQSGLGRESGRAALEANTEVKTIFLSSDSVS
jgi:acyl-CoA reductase-like NAD-dependent aldehyde dehydrogenase